LTKMYQNFRSDVAICCTVKNSLFTKSIAIEMPP